MWMKSQSNNRNETKKPGETSYIKVFLPVFLDNIHCVCYSFTYTMYVKGRVSDLPRNKYPEETVQTILDAALKLFLENGYEQTTILDIVNEMGGLTRGAFYHHFKSKEEVLEALSDKLFFHNNPFEQVKEQNELNGLEKIRWVLKCFYQNQTGQHIGELSSQLLSSPTFLKKFMDDNRKILAPMYQELIEEGINDGSIKVEYAKPVAELFTILTNLWTVPTLFPYSKEEGIIKLKIIQQVTESMGLPVIDDEIIRLSYARLAERSN